jgi:tetratricopeptide (TPR) repeat protein
VRPPAREDEAATRQVASLRRIPEGDRALLPELARSRLIVTSGGPDDEPLAEIAHEALIREWPRLATWVAEDRAFRLWQEGLRARMAEWQAHSNDPGYLLGGPPLVEAEGWLASRGPELSDDDQGYIRAGRRRAQRRRRALRGAVAAVILVLAAFGGLAFWQWQRALVQEREALAAAGRATRARASAEDLIGFITFDLRDKLQHLGRLELLQDAQQRVDAYYERLGVLEDDPDLMRRRAVNLFNSGELQASLGDLAAAARLYEEGARVLERLAADDPDKVQRQRDLSVSLEKVGEIKAAQGDLAGALEAYRQALAIAELLVTDDPSNAGWQLDLVVSLWKLSGEGLARPNAARRYLERALEVLEALQTEGKLHGEHRSWPGTIRQRLQALDSPGN